ncbi:EamA family transporter [Streptomyces sp. HNM0574]|uniref:DMT family transporter n=1 Tax=Streptomyces sp. HNM0574 TaxID=2714954 RepID=UPI00146C49D0|nr:EamA family transporter [Streptomyces sp. HNM0574]NLU68452.1 EamA family transporter [Streptomyces sp. HNM0574]
MGRNGRGGAGPVLGAAVLWGTVGPAQVLAGVEVAPAALGAARMLLGGLVLALCTVRPSGLRTLWAPGVRRWALLGVLVTAAFQVCFLEAVDRTGAALGTAVTFGTVPVVTGVLSRCLEGLRGGPDWWCGTVCSLAGIALLLVPGGGPRVEPVGVLLGAVAGASFGTYVAATRRLGQRGGDTRAAAPVCVLGAGLVVAPWLLAAPDGLGTPRAGLLLGWLALGTTALGYLLFTRGVTRISAATAGTLSLAEPLVATLLGVALLGERPGPVAACGAGLLLTGLALVSVPRRRPSRGGARADEAGRTGRGAGGPGTGGRGAG